MIIRFALRVLRSNTMMARWAKSEPKHR